MKILISGPLVAFAAYFLIGCEGAAGGQRAATAVPTPAPCAAEWMWLRDPVAVARHRSIDLGTNNFAVLVCASKLSDARRERSLAFLDGEMRSKEAATRQALQTSIGRAALILRLNAAVVGLDARELKSDLWVAPY